MPKLSKDKARKLRDKVIAEYKSNPDLTMSQILNDFLKDYNDDIAKEINAAITTLMSAGIVDKFKPGVLPYTLAKLSKALYNNAENTAKVTYQVLQDHIKTQSTINEIREALYDGYGYDELLPIKKSLPKYLSQPLSEEKIKRLKTKSLQNAYINILNSKNDRQLEKAMKVGLEERARYYAERIAKTEEAKAFTLHNAERQLEKGVEYVRWTMSSLHRTTCVCEYYANQDVGYGRGVYKMLDAPAPVYSTHPNCMCSLRPVYREPQYKDVEIVPYDGNHKPPVIPIKDLLK